MSAVKFTAVPCRYRIDNRHVGSDEVDGYAVQVEGLDVRLAVHREASAHWVLDHWDTGFAAHRDDSMIEAIENGVARIRAAIKNGTYGEIVDKAIRNRDERDAKRGAA